MKDSMIVGLIGGAVGAAAIELLNILSGKKLFFGKIASSMIVNPMRSNSLKNKLLGELMHLTVGAGIGSVTAALLKITGKDFTFIKGTFVSLMAWIGLHNLGNKMDLFSIKPHSTKNHYLAFIQHLVYGLSTSVVIKYLANPDTFQQPPIIKSENRTSERSLQNDRPFDPSEIDPKSLDPQVLQFKYPTA